MSFREVQRTLSPYSEARSTVLEYFRISGGDRDKVDTQRRHRELLVEAMTWAEDRLEGSAAGRMTPARLALRGLRRRLEGEGVGS